jgi:hypothetical protein
MGEGPSGVLRESYFDAGLGSGRAKLKRSFALWSDGSERETSAASILQLLNSCPVIFRRSPFVAISLIQ